MLDSPLTHPDILTALGRAGHGSRILIADGNYPASTTMPVTASLVSLNLRKGTVLVTEVLEAITAVTPVEAAYVMAPDTAGEYAADDPDIWPEFRRILDHAGARVELERLERFAFYEASGAPDIALVVATGEPRLYANIILQVGVVSP